MGCDCFGLQQLREGLVESARELRHVFRELGLPEVAREMVSVSNNLANANLRGNFTLNLPDVVEAMRVLKEMQGVLDRRMKYFYDDAKAAAEKAKEDLRQLHRDMERVVQQVNRYVLGFLFSVFLVAFSIFVFAVGAENITSFAGVNVSIILGWIFLGLTGVIEGPLRIIGTAVTFLTARLDKWRGRDGYERVGRPRSLVTEKMLDLEPVWRMSTDPADLEGWSHDRRFKELRTFLSDTVGLEMEREARVISVCGKQKVGKSTTLNGMFGGGFATGTHARTTRGIDVLLLRNKRQDPDTRPPDVLMLDCEGFNSPERIQELLRLGCPAASVNDIALRQELRMLMLAVSMSSVVVFLCNNGSDSRELKSLLRALLLLSDEELASRSLVVVALGGNQRDAQDVSDRVRALALDLLEPEVQHLPGAMDRARRLLTPEPLALIGRPDTEFSQVTAQWKQSAASLRTRLMDLVAEKPLVELETAADVVFSRVEYLKLCNQPTEPGWCAHLLRELAVMQVVNPVLPRVVRLLSLAAYDGRQAARRAFINGFPEVLTETNVMSVADRQTRLEKAKEAHEQRFNRSFGRMFDQVWNQQLADDYVHYLWEGQERDDCVTRVAQALDCSRDVVIADNVHHMLDDLFNSTYRACSAATLCGVAGHTCPKNVSVLPHTHLCDTCCNEGCTRHAGGKCNRPKPHSVGDSAMHRCPQCCQGDCGHAGYPCIKAKGHVLPHKCMQGAGSCRCGRPAEGCNPVHCGKCCLNGCPQHGACSFLAEGNDAHPARHLVMVFLVLIYFFLMSVLQSDHCALTQRILGVLQNRGTINVCLMEVVSTSYLTASDLRGRLVPSSKYVWTLKENTYPTCVGWWWIFRSGENRAWSSGQWDWNADRKALGNPENNEGHVFEEVENCVVVIRNFFEGYYNVHGNNYVNDISQATRFKVFTPQLAP